MCTFYMILESWSKRKCGFGWCQAFHIFGTYFTQSLDDGKMLFCFCILNKNSMTFEETIFYFYFGHSSSYDVLIVSLLPSKSTLNTPTSIKLDLVSFLECLSLCKKSWSIYPSRGITWKKIMCNVFESEWTSYELWW